MDRQLDPRIRTTRIVRRAAMAAALAGFAWAAVAASLSFMRPSVKYGDLRMARVERGAIDSGFDAAGTIVPAAERSLSSPIDARVLRILKRAGSVVRAGEPLLELDTSSAQLSLETLRDRIAQTRSQRLHLESQRDQTVEGLRSRLQQQRLDLEIIRYRNRQHRTLRAEGLLSEEAARESDITVKKAEIDVQQLEKSIESTSRSTAAQIAAVDAELRSLSNQQEQARRQLELARTFADRDGVLTWIADQEGATIRAGDVIARVADLSSYRVEGTVSDVHAAELRPGQAVKVILERSLLRGTVASVDPTILQGTARFQVDLEKASDPRLRNSMRVDLFVVTGSRAGALKVRRGTFTNGVFRVAGDLAVRTHPRFGVTGTDELEIVSGLRAGDEVILSDMSDFAHASEVRLKR
jgi:HlyD family secretion protein